MNYKSLPKWAQKEIEELKVSQNKNEYGAHISNCHIENTAVKHNEHTVKSIESLSEAIQSVSHSNIELAMSIKEVAKSLRADNINMDCGAGISLSNVKHS